MRRLYIIMRMALRDSWHQRTSLTIRLLFLSTLLSVVAVTAILSLSSFLRASLINSSSDLLAGDRQLISPREVSQEWLDKASELGLRSSLAIEFTTMAFSDASSLLVAVKAVDSEYPLKGALELKYLDGHDNSLDDRSGQDSEGRLSAGSAFVQKRLLSLLELTNGSELYVGEGALSVEGEIIQEPDVGFNLAGLQPRVLMHVADVAKTEVLGLGSRAKWRYYFAGPEESLIEFDAWIESRLVSSQRWQGIQGGRPAISSAIDRAESYLLLAASLAVMLASLAISLCARQYAKAQVEGVAVLKTLGLTSRDVAYFYCSQLAIISLVAIAIGAILSSWLTEYMISVVVGLLPERSAEAVYSFDYAVFLTAASAALVATFGFALPQIWSLRKVAPVAVLRPESGMLKAGSRLGYVLAVGATLGIIYAFTQNVMLMLMFFIAGAALIAVLSLVMFVLLQCLKRVKYFQQTRESALQLAIQSLIGRNKASLVQASVYAFALCLFALILISRTSLLQEWQAQLPEDAPNHFLINISKAQVPEVRSHLSESGVEAEKVYPMVRGRLSQINGVDVKVAITKDVAALNRELNLSWAETLPSDNEIVKGEWWDVLNTDSVSTMARVSVESRLAENIDIELGDQLTFTVGPDSIEALVTSIRTVQWDSMRPNFYVFFEPGFLDTFPGTYITSFYLSPEDKVILNDLGRSFPTVSILELDQLVMKIRSIVEQVSVMLEAVLVLILIASLLVVAAITSNSMHQRLEEAILLRTFGLAGKKMRRALFLEFVVLGGLSALTALGCAELGLNLVKSSLLGLEVSLQWEIWLVFPVVSALIVGVMGVMMLRPVVLTPPMAILRKQL
jgi:putative ABC transport system permease protein